MERVPVDSSTLATVGYEANTRVLEIEFRNGRIYQYFGVPESIHNGLMISSSKGEYFNEHIKKAGYSYAKVG